MDFFTTDYLEIVFDYLSSHLLESRHRLNCGYDGCDTAKFHFNNTQSITFDVDQNGLSDASISAQKTTNGITINANGETALYRTKLYCPLFNFATEILTCSDGECSYNCSDSNITCANSIIDASQGTPSSLTVECGSLSACAGTRVKCPSSDYSSCIINCTGSYGCEYIVIEANQAQYVDRFEMICGNPPDNTNSDNCDKAIVMLDFISINTLNIQLLSAEYQPQFTYGDNITNIGLFNYNCTLSCSLISTFQFRARGIIINDTNIYCAECDRNSILDLVVKASASITCVNTGSYTYPCPGSINVTMIDTSGTVDMICINLVDNETPRDYGTCEGRFNIVSPLETNTIAANVNCSTDSSCGGGYFVFTNINQVVIDCNGGYSCYESKIIVDTAYSLSMNCSDYGHYGACDATTVYCPSNGENICSINCDADGYNVCEYMGVYVPKNYSKDYLNLTCGIDAEGCPNPDLDCKDYCDGVSFYCDVGNGHYDITYLEFDYPDYECSNVRCCPWAVNNSNISSTTLGPSSTTTSSGDNITSSDGLTTTELVLIITGVLVVVLVFGFFGFRYLRARKNDNLNYQNLTINNENEN